MTANMPIIQSYPFLLFGCALCPTTISLPPQSFVECANCHAKLCIRCGSDAMKDYGNKLRYISELHCNKCDKCSSDYESSSDDNTDSD